VGKEKANKSNLVNAEKEDHFLNFEQALLPAA